MGSSKDDGAKKRKRGSVVASENEKREKILQGGRELAKREFEIRRTEVLESLPAHYKDMFGQIGFVKWNKKPPPIPVLILSPFDVPQGLVREQWDDAHAKLRARGTLDKMPYLVYWYGTTKLSDLYSFVAQTQFITYEKEKAKGHKGVYKLSPKIQKKLDDGSPLNAKEEETVRSYKEMEEDLLKEPKDRKRGIIDFPEGYDMLSERDLVDIDMEQGDDDDDDDPLDRNAADVFKNADPVIDESESIQPAKKATKEKSKNEKEVKRRKTKRDDTDAADDALADLESEAAHPHEAKKRGGAKKSEKTKTDAATVPKKNAKKISEHAVDEKLKTTDEEKTFKQCQRAYLPLIEKLRLSVENKNIESVQVQVSELTDVVEMFSVKFTMHHKLRALIQLTKEVLKENKADLKSVDAMSSKLWKAHASKNKAQASKECTSLAAKAKVPEAAAVDSDDIGDNENSGGDDDEKSLTYAIEEPLSSQDEADEDFIETGKKTKAKGTLQKTKKAKAAKKTQKTKLKTVKPPTEKQLMAKERQEFKECEAKHSELIERWERACKTDDIEQLQSVLDAAAGVVETFCSTFIIEYELSRILKDTRKALKGANIDLTAFNSVREKISVTYEQKKVLVPKGFKPTKAKPDVAVTTAKSTSNERSGESDLDGSHRSSSTKCDSKSVDATMSQGTNKLTKSYSKSPQKAGDQSERSVASSKSPPRNNSQASVDVAIEGSAAARLAAPPKPPQKFLRDLLPQTSSKDAITRENSAVDVTKAASAVEQAPIPSWVTGPSVLDAPIEDPRSLALEFLLQMAGQFPEGSVNADSLARSVEAAVYEWAKKGSLGNGDLWTSKYWEKIHALVAAICGKQEKGTIQNLILHGQFDVPEKLVTLSDDKLAASFEGLPLTI